MRTLDIYCHAIGLRAAKTDLRHAGLAGSDIPVCELLKLSVELARHGFAVLAFDMRGSGESQPAPLSLGYFEQRDVLGAVDFLRSGRLPFPELGRPRVIAGWGVSLGAATMLLAAAQEPAIRAIVSDSAFTDIIPILEREVPKGSHLPQLFTPGALFAARAIYGVDFYAVRPVDVVASIAPRPIFFIQGTRDAFIPPSNMGDLATAARAAQSFNTAGKEYVDRVVAFYTATLGQDSSGT